MGSPTSESGTRESRQGCRWDDGAGLPAVGQPSGGYGLGPAASARTRVPDRGGTRAPTMAGPMTLPQVPGAQVHRAVRHAEFETFVFRTAVCRPHSRRHIHLQGILHIHSASTHFAPRSQIRRSALAALCRLAGRPRTSTCRPYTVPASRTRRSTPCCPYELRRAAPGSPHAVSRCGSLCLGARWGHTDGRASPAVIRCVYEAAPRCLTGPPVPVGGPRPRGARLGQEAARFRGSRPA